MVRFHEISGCQFKGKKKLTSELPELGLRFGTFGIELGSGKHSIIKFRSLRTQDGGNELFWGSGLGVVDWSFVNIRGVIFPEV